MLRQLPISRAAIEAADRSLEAHLNAGQRSIRWSVERDALDHYDGVTNSDDRGAVIGRGVDDVEGELLMATRHMTLEQKQHFVRTLASVMERHRGARPRRITDGEGNVFDSSGRLIEEASKTREKETRDG